jgi:hypothetical protein
MECARRRYVAGEPSMPADQRGLQLVGNITFTRTGAIGASNKSNRIYEAVHIASLDQPSSTPRVVSELMA